MKDLTYDPARALELMPLLSSIGREIEERSPLLAGIEERVEQLSRDPLAESALLRSLVAEAATHRREIRACRSELERLGCSILGTTPLTIRIPTREGDAKKSLVWRRRPRVRD